MGGDLNKYYDETEPTTNEHTETGQSMTNNSNKNDESKQESISKKSEILLDGNCKIMNPKRSRTGVCYHKDMLLHKCEYGDHPEKPARISSIRRALIRQGFLDHIKLDINCRQATIQELLKTHPQSHINKILKEKQINNLDTYMDKIHSPRAALLSVGGLIQVMELMCEDEIDNGLAIIRPPGHHCEYKTPMGFCLFNNVVVAINVIREKYPKCKKYCIVDWDVHHGNGTQNLFYDDPNVLYISTHRGYGFYPNTGKNKECGKGAGEGYNVNVNLIQGMGSREYLYVFKSLLLPIIESFAPDMIVVSAGFDACIGDPLGHMKILPHTYGLLTSFLLQICKKLVVVLEGGYNLITMPSAVTCVAYSLINSNQLFNLNEFETNIKDLQFHNRWRTFDDTLEDSMYRKTKNKQKLRRSKRKTNNKYASPSKDSNGNDSDSLEKKPSKADILFNKCVKIVNSCIEIQSKHWQCLLETESITDEEETQEAQETKPSEPMQSIGTSPKSKESEQNQSPKDTSQIETQPQTETQTQEESGKDVIDSLSKDFQNLNIE